ncbi:MAG: hypothetical protein K8W52_31050, partial [Deltaproteobacteria bacterium]|nr:hypothetical protein [Deltaproteobacteria bacterium]
MATETNDTRALTAALEAATPFRTLVGTAALHAAERHVDRWAPETGAVGRSRSLRSLAFVDRLVSPWMTTAQQSAALRMYGEYASSGMPSRNNASAVSWVFPRPWFQDELDWMAAARQVAARPAGALTTRGTYVSDEAGSPPLPPVMAPEQRMSPAYAGPMEMVAPALSLGRTPSFQVSPEGRAVGVGREIGLSTALPMPAPLATWSPLVPFAAAQAAQVFAAAITAAVETGLAEQSPMLSSFALVSPADLVAIATREVADAQAAGTLPQIAGAPAADGRRAASAVPAAPGRVLGGLGAGVLQAQLAATLQQIESIRKFGGESTTLGIARSAPEMSTPPAPFADAPMREHGGPERLLARMDAVRATEAVVAAAAEAVRVAIAERDAAAPSVASPSIARATTPDEPQAREQFVEAPAAIAPAFSAPTPVVDGATPLETRAPDVRAPVSSAAPSTVAPVKSVAAIESAAAVPAAPPAAVAPQAAPAGAIPAAALDTTKPADAAAPSIPAPAATSTAPERRDAIAQPLPESVLSAVVEAVATSLPTGVARALSQPGALSSETMAAIARTVAASPAAAAALRVIEL